jgi:hypothetical protein
MHDIKFFVDKAVYLEENKPIQTAVKDLIGAHVGDVTICNNILDYVGERLTMPRGGSIASRKKYEEAVVRTAIDGILKSHSSNSTPLVVETPEGSVPMYDIIHDSTEINPW